MERLLMKELIAWKNKKKKKPILLKGARQVGKTWLMREFGRSCFSNVVYINFDRKPALRSIFLEDFDVKRILRMLNIESGERIIPEKTLIIFDEIQEAPEAIASLKYFCEDAPEYPIIAAGSLLGVAIHKGISFPVGKIETMQVYPMSYVEFLMAMGEESLANLILDGELSSLKPFADRYAHWLKLYYYIGGMPEAVSDYAENGDIVSVRAIQNTILELYDSDFGKHVEKDELLRVRLVWNSIPLQLSKENKKFFFGQIKKGARLKDFENAIEWLLDCGLIYKVYRVEKPGMPLKAYTDFSAYKIFTVDVGLLAAMSGLTADTLLNGNDLFTEFRGALTEQYVFQEIKGSALGDAYYFSASSYNEIDFMIQQGEQIVPIEVKAEENVKSKSLKAYVDKYAPEKAVRISMKSYKKEDWLINIPLYAVMNL